MADRLTRARFAATRPLLDTEIRAFLLERGIAVRQGLHFLRAELPGILAKRTDVLSPRMSRIIEDLAGDWRRLGGCDIRPFAPLPALRRGRSRARHEQLVTAIQAEEAKLIGHLGGIVHDLQRRIRVRKARGEW